MPNATLGNITAEAKQFYQTDLLYHTRSAQVFYQYGKKTSLPLNMGNSVSWRRFEQMATASTALTEGVPPSASTFTVSEVTATVSPYGNYVSLTDMLAIFSVDKTMMELTQLLGQNGGESIEAVTSNALSATTTNQYVGGGTTKSSVSSSNVITAAEFRHALETLDVNKAHRFAGQMENDRLGLGGYIAFVHPHVVYDFYNDTELKNALQYQEDKGDDARIWTGYIGSIYGVQLVQTTLTPFYSAAGNSNANLYGTIVIAQEAFGVLDAAGRGKYELVIHDFGSSGAYDPVNQLATVGWKAFNAPTILNNNFMVQIISGATHG